MSTPWQIAVSRWIERNSFVAESPVPASRFAFDRAIYVQLARKGSVQHAAFIVLDWYRCLHRGTPTHPHVAAYMRLAERKYSPGHDPDRAMRKALGLTASRAGSHGFTDDMKRDAAEIVTRKLGEGEKEEVAVRLACDQTGMSARAVRAAVAEFKQQVSIEKDCGL